MKLEFDAWPDGLVAVTWAIALADHLAEIAAPVFSRQEQPAPEKAAAIRLAALCLAAEANILDRADIGSEFGALAADVTWLEQRSSGTLPATEVIMLAM